jgi:hypothetical protein
VVNIANDMRLRLENDVAALDRSLNLTVHNYVLTMILPTICAFEETMSEVHCRSLSI